MAGRVVVTGASRGIGRALALRLAQRGHSLVVTARTASDLESLAREVAEKHRVDCQVVACDLAQVEGRERLVARCAELGPIVGLVNNAGFGTGGRFESIDAAREREMIRLNVEAVTDLCHAFIPRLKGQQGAFVLNVASSAGFQAVPLFAAYSATKAYVLSLSEALAEELAPEGVHVLALCPGATTTGFQEASGVFQNDLKGAATADEVAACALAGLDARKRVVIHPFGNVLLTFSQRLAPRKLVVKLAGKVVEPWFKQAPR